MLFKLILPEEVDAGFNNVAYMNGTESYTKTLAGEILRHFEHQSENEMIPSRCIGCSVEQRQVITRRYQLRDP